VSILIFNLIPTYSLNGVPGGGDDYSIKRAGKPLVAVVSMEKFQALQKDQDAALSALEQIWAKIKDEDPKAIAKIINEAVEAARAV
jgi:hypothetical protein